MMGEWVTIRTCHIARAELIQYGAGGAMGEPPRVTSEGGVEHLEDQDWVTIVGEGGGTDISTPKKVLSGGVGEERNVPHPGGEEFCEQNETSI